MSVREAYWTTEESLASIARRYGVTPEEVERLGQWSLFAMDGVPSWAAPGRPRTMKRASIMDLFALPPETGANGGSTAMSGTHARSQVSERSSSVQGSTVAGTTRPAAGTASPRATAVAEPDPHGLTDDDVVELRETYVEERGILDSIAEAFELPRARVIRLLKGEERREAGGPIYRDLDIDALTI
jgi:hypothetical protein